MASTSSSVTASPSPTQGWMYDVFLSFRGPDTRKTFIDFLYESLERKGIRTFKDDDRLEKGDCISPSLLKAIQESEFFIAVFSKGYASSKWCLEELATMMECHEKFKNQIVVPIFYHVEPSDVRKQEGSFGDSFNELVERFVKDEEEEKVRRWKGALKNAGYLKGHHLQNDYNGYEATCAEKVAADIHARLNQASLAFEKNLVGLESRVNNIINWLRLASDDDDADARFIGICGMGGIGKTTNAMVVFNRFSHQFDGACFLADVRQHNIIELQKTLLSEVLKEKSGVQISNAQDGKAKIGMRLKGKKVLIVLDDVDDQLKQLDELAGGRDWFGRGSRVIITTRDAGVLRSHGIDENYIYQVDTLEEQEAIQLFSLYAFKEKIPKTGFEALCGSIVLYARGLPLCLKVLGSHLCGKNAVSWETILKKLEDANSLRSPKDKILNVLRISFDGLDPENKNVFLDITCFFRNWREEYVKGVLDSDLCDLIEKSLISVQNGRIEMHDRIQEMGRYIASQEKPWRLWQVEDAVNVLRRKKDLKDIEGISWFVRWTGDDSRWGDDPVKISFREIINLKMFKGVGYRNCFHVTDNDLPSSLRWLEIDFYHFASLSESFASSELVGLSLQHSSLQNWRITQKLDKLTLLDLSWSKSLLETPNFDWMPNLRKLNLQYCTVLKVVHPSIGNLNKLVLLDLSNCYELESLPSFNQVSSLNSLDLSECTELKNFPEIKERMPHLVELKLIEVGIIELHPSIQQLQGLTKLYLNYCEDLVCLSNSFCELKNLKVLAINNCTNLKSLPENLQDLISLEYLNLNKSYLDSFPKSFNQLPCLQCLDIRNCETLKKLPKLPETTRQLYADCSVSCRRDIDELADFPELQSVAFSSSSEWSEYDFAEMCIHFLSSRKTPFSITYPINFDLEEVIDVLRIFQYRCYKSNGIAIDLNPGWNYQSFVGFAVWFFAEDDSHGDVDPPKPWTIIVKLSCKDNKNEVLQKKCVIIKSGYYNSTDDHQYCLCFAYIPFSGLWPAKSNSVTPNDFSRFEVTFMDSEGIANWDFMNSKGNVYWGCSLLYEREKRSTSWDDSYKGSTTDIGPLDMLEYLNLSGLWPKSKAIMDNITPNHYSVFEAAIQDLEISRIKPFWLPQSITDDATPHWSCGLLYTDDESLTEAIRKKREAGSSESDLGHRTKLWEFTKIVDQVQCQVIFMTECSDVKVARLLYTNPGGILALRSNGIQKLWKWPNNEQNPTGKATANSAPEHWQPNSGLMINDVDVNPEEVVSCIDLSKNDSYIVSAAGKKVSLLDIMTFEVLTTFNPPSTPTFLVFCACDNNIIAIGMEDATIIIYNVRLNKVKIRLIKGHHKHITGLAFSTTDPKMLVSSSADAQLCVWNIVGRRQNRRSVRIQSPDGEVCSGDTHVMFHTVQLHLLLVTHETQLAIYDTSNLERKRQDVVHAVVIAAHPQKPNQLAIGLTDGSIKVIEPLESEGEWGISPPIDIEILNGTGEAEQREPNLANEDCEPEEISALTQIELGTGEAEQSEPNPVNEDCEPEEISVRTQIELGTVEVEQVEPNPANEDCEAAKKSVLTQLEQGTGEAEQTEPNPTNEDCELEERSVVTQPELGTGEAEQSEPNPAN